MNKFQLYRQIREELAAHYDKELRSVVALLEEGVDAVVGANARITCTNADSLVTNGDASKVFREEMSEAVRLILERYQRSLRKEIETLGLTYDGDGWKEPDTRLPSALSRSTGARAGNGAESH
ncbi:MAG: hypothetical protein K0U34_06585 [Alphaproteobacteria bacterium]|nr:hypothetical protein [Alphaproteobacteria bacterium]